MRTPPTGIRRSLRILAMITLFAAPYARAADEKPNPLVPPSRVALLPWDVDNIIIGPDQRSWVISASPWTSVFEDDARTELEREFNKPQPHLAITRPVFFEPGGRVWVQFLERPRNSQPVLLGYDGKTFVRHTLDVSLAIANPSQVRPITAASAGGAVFFATGPSILSYDGKSWNTFEPFAQQRGNVHFVADVDGRGITAICGARLLHWRARPDGDEHFNELPAPVPVTDARPAPTLGLPAYAAATPRTLWTLNPPDSRQKGLELNLWRTPLPAPAASGPQAAAAQPIPYRLSKIKALIPLPQGAALVVAEGITSQDGKTATFPSLDPAHPEPLPAKVIAIAADDSLSLAGGDALRDVLTGHDFPFDFVPDFSTSKNLVSNEEMQAYNRNTAIAASPISIIPLPDGSAAWFTPHDTLIPVLVNLKTFRLIERLSDPLVSQPLSRSPQGVFFARGRHQVVACNPASPDTRIAPPAKVQVEGVRTFITGDGTLWIAAAKGTFSYFDGQAVHPIKSDPVKSLDHILVGEGALFPMDNVNAGQWGILTRTGFFTEAYPQGGGGGAGAAIAGTKNPQGAVDKHSDLFVREFIGSIPQTDTHAYYIVQTDNQGRLWTVGDRFQGFGIYSAEAGGWIPNSIELPEKITVYSEGKPSVLENKAFGDNLTPAWMEVHMSDVAMFLPVGDRSVFYLFLNGKYGSARSGRSGNSVAFFVSLEGDHCKLTPAPLCVPDPYGRPPIHDSQGALLLPVLAPNQPADTPARRPAEGRDPPPPDVLTVGARLTEKGVQTWRGPAPVARDANGNLWLPTQPFDGRYYTLAPNGSRSQLPADFLPSPATQFLAAANGNVYATTDIGLQEFVCTDPARATFVTGRLFKFPGPASATTLSGPFNVFCTTTGGRVILYPIPPAAPSPK